MRLGFDDATNALSAFGSVSVSQLVTGHHARRKSVLFDEVATEGGKWEKRDLLGF